MNHYQNGFLAGLKNEPSSANPLGDLMTQWLAGVDAKVNNTKLSAAVLSQKGITFSEGFMSNVHPHLKCKGNQLEQGFNDWVCGHLSGTNKANNVLATDVHNVAFTVEVETPKNSIKSYDSFVQHYTYLDHRNEVYRIEARHRHNLTSKYPNEHIVNESPCLPEHLSLPMIEKAVGLSTIVKTHDILQKSFGGYQPLTIMGVNFVIKKLQVYAKVALDIPEWNSEAQTSVSWDIEYPAF